MDITTIKKLSNQKKLIPFLGAGFSLPLGLPSWESLIRNLAPSLGWDPDVFMQSGNNNYLQLAEYYISKKSKGELRNEISKGMAIDPLKLSASLAHKYLVELKPNSIYTTNYDEGIEQAFQLYGQKYNVIRNKFCRFYYHFYI